MNLLSLSTKDNFYYDQRNDRYDFEPSDFIFLDLGDKKGKVLYVAVIGLCTSYLTGLLLYDFVWANEQSTADKIWNVLPMLGGILCEVFSIASIAIALLRFRNKKQPSSENK